MVDIHALNPQYLTDAQGNRTAVLLPVDAFEELLEDLTDLAAIAERRDEPAISHEEVLGLLGGDGSLPD